MVVRKKIIITRDKRRSSTTKPSDFVDGGRGYANPNDVRAPVPKGVIEVNIPGMPLPMRIRNPGRRGKKISFSGKTFLVRFIGGEVLVEKIEEKK